MAKRSLRTILVIFTILTTLSVSAQDLSVRSFSRTIDQTANLAENLHKDNNGEYGGLVKVRLAAADAEFEGWVLKTQKNNASEYWVFMAKGSNKLTVVVPGFLPLDVEFRSYGINSLLSKTTYLLTVVMPQFNAANARGVVNDNTDASTLTPSQMNELGMDYYQGRNGKVKNYPEAAKWFQMAADKEFVGAYTNLGRMHVYGLGVDKSYDEALKWFRKAADKGNPDGLNAVGYMYKNGYGVKQDHSEALKWYRMAAEQGNVKAITNIGLMYERGESVKQDEAEAVKWYLKAAEKGHARAQCNLGNCFANGRGVAKDYEKAVEWYQKAADQGLADAQTNLGYAYDHGNGVRQDYQKALEWYKKAAEQGSAMAQNNIGWSYAEGHGVPQDYQKLREKIEL